MGLEKYALGQYQGDPQSLDEAQGSAGGLTGDYRLNYSSNDDGVGGEKVIRVPAYSASDSVLVFDVPQPPSPHSFVSGWSGDTEEHRCCGQIKDRVIP